MTRWQRLYVIGIISVILLFILGELVWLPDPVRIGPAFYWIDALDVLVLLLPLIPLLWCIAAMKGIAEWRLEKKDPANHLHPGFRLYLILIRRIFICTMSFGAMAVMAYMAINREMEFRLLISFIVLLGGGWLLGIWDVAAAERRMRAGGLPWRSLSCLFISAGLLAALFCPTSSLVTYPGLTVNMSRYAAAEGGSAKGKIMGVLVFDRPAFPADWLYAKLFPHYVFRSVERLGMPIGAYESLVRDLKAEADAMGSAIAFRAAGIGKGAESHGAKVLTVELDGPAFGKMRPGDVIIEIDGGAVASTADLQDRMRYVQPGDDVQVKLLRNQAERTAIVSTREHPDDEKRAAFGIHVMDDLQLDLPRKVKFHTYFAHEGGPSHGAALALALLDQLTPGGVTKGNRVAVTGTIQPDGTVGQIGGIRQKAFTVSRAGADVFFVPSGQEAEARIGAPELLVVPVEKLYDMMNWLENNPK